MTNNLAKVWHLENQIHQFKKPFYSISIACIAGYILLFALHSKFRNGVFVQDDPYLIEFLNDEETSLTQKIFSTGGNRWRPIANLTYLLVSRLVETSYFRWFLISILFLTLTALYISLAFLKRYQNVYLSTVLFLLVLTSRFSNGILLNFAFLLESVSIMLLFTLLLIFHDNWSNSEFQGVKIALLIYVSLILTHERFVGMNLFFLFYFLLSKNYSFKLKFVYSLSFTIPTISLFLAKTFALKIPIFVGTGTAWGVGFSITSALQFSAILFIGLLGANVGLEYLHGYIFQNQAISLQITSILLVLITLKIVLNAILHPGIGLQQNRGKTLLRPLVVIFALFLSLAIPIVSTIRIESRWFFPIYIIFLYLLLSRFYAKDKSRNSKSKLSKFESKSLRQKSTWVLIFFLGSLLMNIVYTQRLDGLYYVRTQNVVKSQIDSVLPYVLNSNEIKNGIYLLDQSGSFDINSFNVNFRANNNFQNSNLQLINDLSEIKSYSSSDVILEMDTTSYDAGFRVFDAVKNSVSISGDFYGDSWAGKSVRIVSVPVLCRQVEIGILPSPWTGTFDVNFGQSIRKYKISDSIIFLTFPVSKELNEVIIDFKKTFVPYKLGLNDDRRELSHRIQTRCLN
jgi:hypothetical protein